MYLNYSYLVESIAITRNEEHLQMQFFHDARKQQGKPIFINCIDDRDSSLKSGRSKRNMNGACTTTARTWQSNKTSFSRPFFGLVCMCPAAGKAVCAPAHF
jgi:hypothetical protein